jgi:Ring finger domain
MPPPIPPRPAPRAGRGPNPMCAPTGGRGPFPMRAPTGGRGPFPMHAPTGGRGPFPMRAPTGGRGPFPMRAPTGGRGPFPMRAPTGGRGPFPMRAPTGGRGPLPTTTRPAAAPATLPHRLKARPPLIFRGADSSGVPPAPSAVPPAPSAVPPAPSAVPPAPSAGRVRPRDGSSDDMSIDNSIAGILRGLNRATEEFTAGLQTESASEARPKRRDSRTVRFAADDSEGSGSDVRGFRGFPIFDYAIWDDDNDGAIIDTNISADTRSAVTTLDSDSDEDDEGNLCVVCWQAFTERDQRQHLPCLHTFHEKCIEKYILERAHPSCPSCRSAIRFPVYLGDGNVITAESHAAAWALAATVSAATAPAAAAAAAAAAAPPAPAAVSESCAVCLETVDSADTTFLVRCMHGFHRECIQPWVLTNHRCPVCRRAATSLDFFSPRPFTFTANTDPSPIGAGVPTDAPASQMAAAENAGTPTAGVMTADTPAAGAPAPSEVTKRGRSKQNAIQPSPQTSPHAVVVTVAAAENAGVAAPSNATVASDASGSPSKRRRANTPVTNLAADVLVQVPDANNVGALVAGAPALPVLVQVQPAENVGAPVAPAPSGATVVSDVTTGTGTHTSGSGIPEMSPDADVLVQVPAAENVGAPVASTPDPSGESIVSDVTTGTQTHSSGSGIPEMSPDADVLVQVQAAENVGAPGETVASDVSAGTQRSGVLSWFGWQTEVAPPQVAPPQVDQGLPLLSAPLNRRVHVVHDDGSQQGGGIGEVSFDTATEGDEVSAVTSEMNFFESAVN